MTIAIERTEGEVTSGDVVRSLAAMCEHYEIGRVAGDGDDGNGVGYKWTAKEIDTSRRALVQGDYHAPRGTAGREPGTVSWAEHEEAWAQYARDGHGSQSAERINERGGFGYEEISKLLRRTPTTWKASVPQ